MITTCWKLNKELENLPTYQISKTHGRRRLDFLHQLYTQAETHDESSVWLRSHVVIFPSRGNEPLNRKSLNYHLHWITARSLATNDRSRACGSPKLHLTISRGKRPALNYSIPAATSPRYCAMLVFREVSISLDLGYRTFSTAFIRITMESLANYLSILPLAMSSVNLIIKGLCNRWMVHIFLNKSCVSVHPFNIDSFITSLE